MGGSSKPPPPQEQTVGYEYRVDMRQDLCLGPVDAILEIQVDKETVWTGNVTSAQQISIDAHNIFGGIKKEGGVSGLVDVIMGTSSQLVNTYMGPLVGSLCPAYRNIAALVLKQFYIGNSTYTKPWKTKVKRIQNTIDDQPRWYSAKAEIGSGQMNPAHIIQEIITDTVFGLAEPTTKIGDSFTAMADLLYDEGFGLSYIFDAGGDRLSDAVGDILSTIDGTVYVDPTTGKFEMNLARDNFDPETIPTIYTEDIISFSDFKRPSPSTSANKITLTYTDHQTGKPKTVSVADTASYFASNSVVTNNVEYGSISTQELALRIATRESKKQGARPFTLVITGNSTLAQFRPLDVFKLNYTDLGINDKVVRVLETKIGGVKNQKVTLKLVEDIYALGFGSITGVTDNKSESASNDPEDVTEVFIQELPYYILAKDIYDEGTMEVSTELDSGLMISAVEPTSDSNSFLIAESFTTGNETVSRFENHLFSSTADLDEIIPNTTDEVTTTIINPNDIDSSQFPGFGFIENEIIWVTSYNPITNEMIFERAVLDSVTAEHAASTPIYLAGNRHYGYTYEKYAESTTAYFKMLTDTATGTLDIADATEHSLSVDTRYLKPYRPRGYISSWVAADPVDGNLRLDWIHTNRITDVSDIPLFNDDSTITPEVGNTYNLSILKQYDDATPDDLVLVTGITAEFYELTEVGPKADHYDIELEAERDAIVSYAKWEETKSRA